MEPSSRSSYFSSSSVKQNQTKDSHEKEEEEEDDDHNEESPDKSKRRKQKNCYKSARKMSLTFYLTVLTIFVVTTALFVFLSTYIPRTDHHDDDGDPEQSSSSSTSTTTTPLIDRSSSSSSVIDFIPKNNNKTMSKASYRNFTLHSLIPKLSQCGHKNGLSSSSSRRKRIIGGQKVDDPNEYPWIAQIAAEIPGLGEVYHCGGTLISTRYILTSAHCLYNIPPTHVKLRSDSQPFEIESVTLYPGYVKLREMFQVKGYRARFDDVALLRLSREARFPICLPFKRLYGLEKSDFDTTEGQVAGHGFTSNNDTRATDFLHHVTLSIVDSEECQTFFEFPDIITKKMFCAGGNMRDFCRGDSGAAFFVSSNDKIFQLGIATYGGKVCGQAPGVFTATADYLNFILETIHE